MRHLTVRLQLVWLTIVALAAFALLAATRLEGGIVEAEFARTVAMFRGSLKPDDSIATLNLFRAQLAADMVFLVAYGLLLRQSVLHLGRRRRWARWAAHAAVLVMIADATENLSALTVLRSIVEPEGAVPSWVFVVMNVAAATKWAVAGALLVFLAVSWRDRVPPLVGALKFVGWAIVLLFGLGGLASLAVVATLWFPRVGAVAAPVAIVGPAIAFLLQFRLLDLIGVAVRLVYLTRVPLLVLLVAAAFGPIALGPAAGLLGGIIDVPSGWGIGVVTATAVVLAFACATQINLVRAYGWQRTLDRSLRVVRHRVLARAVSWTALVAVASLLFSIALVSPVSRTTLVFGVILGAVVGVVFVFVVEWMAALLSQSVPGRVMPQLAVPFTRTPFLADWLRDARDAPAPPALAAVKTQVQRWSIAGRLFGLASGYIEAVPGGGRRLLAGHTFALIQLALSLLFYGLLLYGKAVGPERSAEQDIWVPTAGSIVLLLMVVSWALAGIAFFLDRYRTPLIVAILLLVLVTGSRPHTGYEVAAPTPGGGQYQLATPGKVLAAFPRPILVAAAGGGIQAGAWTARVLEGIDQRLGGDFRNRAALVSSVSGGSMGALYYGVYQDRVRVATERSLEPSLDQIATALIGPDLVRVLGVRFGTDRGEALERSWALRLPDPRGEVTLRSWADRVRDFADGGAASRAFPAFLFNTTIVETGQPMAFATTQFPTAAYRDSFSRAGKQYPVAESANGIYRLSSNGESARDVGLETVTAARLSAAFPYVSPAAALRIEGSERFHLVDGGYYDNYGLVALTQWLDDALEEMPQRPTEISVVIIRGLAESGDGIVRELREGEEQRALQAGGPRAPSRGWAWQLIAPPFAFLRTRSFGQWAGGNQALKLLTEKWRDRADRKVVIRSYLFDFPSEALPPACRVAPLSWKLSAVQQQCIETGWGHVAARTDFWEAAR